MTIARDGKHRATRLVISLRSRSLFFLVHAVFLSATVSSYLSEVELAVSSIVLLPPCTRFLFLLFISPNSSMFPFSIYQLSTFPSFLLSCFDTLHVLWLFLLLPPKRICIISLPLFSSPNTFRPAALLVLATFSSSASLLRSYAFLFPGPPLTRALPRPSLYYHAPSPKVVIVLHSV